MSESGGDDCLGEDVVIIYGYRRVAFYANYSLVLEGKDIEHQELLGAFIGHSIGHVAVGYLTHEGNEAIEAADGFPKSLMFGWEEDWLQ